MMRTNRITAKIKVVFRKRLCYFHLAPKTILVKSYVHSLPKHSHVPYLTFQQQFLCVKLSCVVAASSRGEGGMRIKNTAWSIFTFEIVVGRILVFR